MAKKKYVHQLNKTELKDFARANGINAVSGATKKEILDLIEAAEIPSRLPESPASEPETPDRRQLIESDMHIYPELRPYISMRGYLRFNLSDNDKQQAEQLCAERGLLLPDTWKDVYNEGN